MKLEIAASPPNDADRQGLAHGKFLQVLMQLSGQKPTATIHEADISQDEYDAMVRHAYESHYVTTTGKKPPSTPAATSVTEMESKLKADLDIDVSDDALIALAKRRADVVETYLVREAKLAKARVINTGLAAKADPDTRVNLSLK